MGVGIGGSHAGTESAGGITHDGNGVQNGLIMPVRPEKLMADG
jgi:hypothetical protein